MHKKELLDMGFNGRSYYFENLLLDKGVKP